ncbi:MAG: AsmA family protein [Burkholderiales bacterium]
MRTWTKVLLGLVAVLAIVAVGLAVAISTFDVDTLIGPLKDRVKAATGRDLAIRGGARIALSLSPRVVVNDVALSNAPWGQAKELATAKRLEFELALLPLLSRRVELKEVALVEPVIALETDPQGRKNWDFGSAGPGTPAGSAASGAGGATLLPAGSLSITRGTVSYRDGATGSVTHAAIDMLAVHARSPEAPMDARFKGTVGRLPLALEGRFGPLRALLERRWPYPVDVAGEIAGQKFALAAKVKADDRRYSLDDLRVTLGANALTGSFAVVTGGARPQFDFDLSGPALALAGLPLPATAGAPPAPAASTAPTTRAFVIPDAPVDFEPLRWADARGTLAVGRLTLAGGRVIDNLRVKLKLDGSRLDVESFSLKELGGTLSGSFTVDARDAGRTALSARIDGKGLSFGAILAAAGEPREVKGGSTDLAVDLTMQGASPHAWAGTATGTVRVVVGPATLVNTRIDVDSALDNLTRAINPFRASDPSTEVRCIVVRLPLANGVARFDRTVAAETAKVGVAASGRLDFRNETLDVAFHPKVRKGISIDVASLADLVHVTGPFAAPQVRIDPVGSVKAIASIGAAIGTGGLSAIGQALFAWSEGSGPGPCQLALGTPPPAATTAGAGKSGGGDPANALVNDVGKAVGKLFGR